jgi:hypothetical protein
MSKMLLEKSAVKAAVVAVLNQVQATCGRECPHITGRTKPIGDIEGFDSLLAVEATVILEQALGCPLADGTPFLSADGTKALRVDEIVDRVIEMALPGKAA